MRFPPVPLSLRDGRPAQVREATRGDGPALLELERAMVLDRHGVVKRLEELPVDAVAFMSRREAAGLHRLDGTAFALVVTDAHGALLGEASILRHGFQMLRHTGVLGIGVHLSAQGLGVGRALMEHLLTWVRAHRDPDGGAVTRVELHVRADNTKAVALYRSMGFVIEGTQRAHLRVDDGTYVDGLIMGLLLDASRA
ncbi:N-acetyltransferase family protein [Corallococcus terminator]